MDCGAPSGWPQVKSWYINGHDFQIFIDINISLSPFISFKEILIQFKQKKYDQRLNMTEAYCWKGRFCKLFWFFSVLAQIVFFVLYACFVETSLMQLQNQLLPYLLKIFQFTARLKKQLFRHSPTQEGKDMFLIFQFLLAPSGALIAIPTYYWSPPPHFFRYTPVLNTGLSLTELYQRQSLDSSAGNMYTFCAR